MREDIDRETQPAGRSIRVLAAGDTMQEIELAALDEARTFFGADAHLMIVPDYGAVTIADAVDSFLAKYPKIADSGKRWYAGVVVRTVEG